MGSFRYFLFYFLVGTAGALAQCYTMPDSTAPMIGASGRHRRRARGYLMLYPRARIQTLVMIPFLWPVVPVPAWVFLGGWFVAQFAVASSSGVAWMAHVGGFLAGLGAVRLLANTRRGPPAAPVEYIPPARRGPGDPPALDTNGPARKIAASETGPDSCVRRAGGLAQLVRAGVSYAPGPGFESLIRHEASGPGKGKRVDKPWGHEMIRAVTDRYVGKVLHIKAGESCRCSTTGKRTRR